jgi:CRP/FNR family cyclic AMP-dependent transcriptional regulator
MIPYAMTTGQMAQVRRPPPSEAIRARVQRALKLCQLFERGSRTTREAAINASDIDVLPGGSILLEQASPPNALAVIGRGRARVERITPFGKVVPLGYRGGGDVLGEACLGKAPSYNETATAMEEVELVRVPVPVIEECLATDPAFGAAVLSLLLTRQRETEDRIESLLFRNVEGRLVEFLLKAAERWGVPSPKGMLISAPITHLEIAQSIGSTRETVTLTLGALRREGLLDVAGRRLIIRDREALATRS